MTTANDIIKDAAMILGVLRKGEVLDADEAQDGLNALNDLMASWASMRLINLSSVRDTFTLTNSATHEIGAGKTLNTVAPLVIKYATITVGSIDYPLEIITDDQYESIALKSTQASPSYFLNYNHDSDEDAGIIRIYPVPSGGDILNILSEKKSAEISSLFTTVYMPQAGFKRALKYNLALELAPQYGVEPSAMTVKIANDSLGAIKLETARNKKIVFNSTVRAENIYTGWYS